MDSLALLTKIALYIKHLKLGYRESFVHIASLVLQRLQSVTQKNLEGQGKRNRRFGKKPHQRLYISYMAFPNLNDPNDNKNGQWI